MKQETYSRVAWIQLVTDDPAALANWFCEELWFAKVESDDCRIIRGNCRIQITKKYTLDKDYSSNTYFSGYEHLALETPDIQEALGYCKQRGMQLETDNGNAFFNPKVWGTGMYYFNILTDFGLKVEISQRLDRKAPEQDHVVIGLEHLGLETSDIVRSIQYYESLGFSKACNGVENITADGTRVFCQMMTLADVILELYQFPHKTNYCMNENNGFKCLILAGEDRLGEAHLSVGPDGECAVLL